MLLNFTRQCASMVCPVLHKVLFVAHALPLNICTVLTCFFLCEMAGLKNFLIPYRRQLVDLQQSGRPLIQFGWLSNLRWRSWNFRKT